MILEFLHEHRVLSIHQLCQLFFTTPRIARRRMLILKDLGLVDRFEPPLVRSGPNYYVLDHLGARVVAAHRGIELRQLGWRKEDVESIAFRPDFSHLTATNEFLVRLMAACRKDPRYVISDWRGERSCVREFAETIYPDAYARIDGPEGWVDFALELDQGTESPSRLAGKLPRYEEAALLDNCPIALLFSFREPEREVSARKRLYNPGLVVATGVFDVVTNEPFGSVWLPIGSEQRVQLLALAALRQTPEASA
jgi:Replication-relaxation